MPYGETNNDMKDAIGVNDIGMDLEEQFDYPGDNFVWWKHYNDELGRWVTSDDWDQ